MYTTLCVCRLEHKNKHTHTQTRQCVQTASQAKQQKERNDKYVVVTCVHTCKYMHSTSQYNLVSVFNTFYIITWAYNQVNITAVSVDIWHQYKLLHSARLREEDKMGLECEHKRERERGLREE